MPRDGGAEQYSINRRRSTSGRSGGLSPVYIGNQAFADQMRKPYNSQGTGLPQGGGGPDPMELFLRTQQELNAVSGYPDGGGGGGGGSRSYGGGGGGGRGGGGGGGGGGGASAAYTGQLAGIDASINQLAQYYGQASGSLGGFAEAARQRAVQENATLTSGIKSANAESERALQQRTQAINAILAGITQQQGMFDQVAQRDLQGQGIQGAGYQQAAQLEQARMGQFGAAQKLYGADLDANVRAGMANRNQYSAQSQRDALTNITAQEQIMLSQLAAQRAKAEADLVSQRAQVRAEAAAQGVRI